MKLCLLETLYRKRVNTATDENSSKVNESQSSCTENLLKKKRNVTGCCWNLKNVSMSFKFDQKDLISGLKVAAIITKTNAIPVSIQSV